MAQTATDRGDLAVGVGAGAGAAKGLAGGSYLLMCGATFGGGHVDLEVQDPAGNWHVVKSFTVDGTFSVSLPPGQYRANVTTSTAASLYAIRVPA